MRYLHGFQVCMSRFVMMCLQAWSADLHCVKLTRQCPAYELRYYASPNYNKKLAYSGYRVTVYFKGTETLRSLAIALSNAI